MRRAARTARRGGLPRAAAAVMAAAIVAAWPRPAAGARFDVDSPADLGDANPGDGACEIAPGGACTLRAAVQEANALPGPDEIVLPAGDHALTSAGAGEDAAATGDLDVLDDLTISGAGSGVTGVSGAGDRLVDVAPFVTATLRDVSLSGGGLPLDDGGLVRGIDAFVTLDRVIARRGGALRGGGVSLLRGRLVAVDTVVSSCVTSVAAGARGGGISLDQATATLLRCDVSDNASSAGTGGGLWSSGSLELTDCTVARNAAGLDGGGAWIAGDARVTGASFRENVARGEGGGLFTSANAILSRVTIADNTASTSGGGLLLDSAVASIDDSTLSGNRVYESPVAGGGACARSSDLRITNATIAGNVVAAPGIGGGLHVDGGACRLANVTLADNSAAAGGGISATTEVEMSCSILAGNAAAGTPCLGTLRAIGAGLVDDDTGCALTGDVTAVLIGLDPLLAPLADNGGTTLTRALDPLSPAVDAGDAGACTDAFGAPLAADQRGLVRPEDGDGDGTPLYDLGAFELKRPCLVDTDGDTWCDDLDLCPDVADPGQENGDGDSRGDACDPCPLDPLDSCALVSILRNATLTTLTFAQHAALLRAGASPVLDPVRDLFQANVTGLPSVTVPGDAAVGSGVLVFYEAAGSFRVMSVRAAGADVVLSGF